MTGFNTLGEKKGLRHVTYDPAVLLLSYGGQSRGRLSRQLNFWRQFATGIDLTTDCEGNHSTNTTMNKDGIIQKINLIEGEILEHVKERIESLRADIRDSEEQNQEAEESETGEVLNMEERDEVDPPAEVSAETTVENNYKGPETTTVENIYMEVAEQLEEIYENPETNTVENIYKEVNGQQEKIVRKFHRKKDCQKVHDGEKDSACHLLKKQGQ